MIQNNYPRANAFLARVREKDRELKELRMKLRYLRDISTSITSKISDMPHTPSPNVHNAEELMTTIIDLEKEIADAEISRAEIRADIALRLTEWLDADAAGIMIRRYSEGMQWSAIVSETGLSDRTIFRLHHDALPVIEAALQSAEIGS